MMLRIVPKSESADPRARASSTGRRAQDRSAADSERSFTKEELIWICALSNMR